MLDLRSKSRAMQFVTNMIADLPETKRFGDRITVAHVYGTGNVFADAESRGNDALVAQLVKAIRVTYERLPLTARAARFVADVRQRHRITVDQNRVLSAVVSVAAAADVRSAASPTRSRPLSSVERGVSSKHRKCVTGDGPGSGYDSDELPPFTPLACVPPTPPPAASARSPGSGTPSSPPPCPTRSDRAARLVLPPLESSSGPELRHSPQPPARFGSAPEPIAPRRLQSPPMPKLESGGKAASKLAQRRDMADSDPTMAPTMATLRAELSKGTSEYSIAGTSDSLMDDVFQRLRRLRGDSHNRR